MTNSFIELTAPTFLMDVDCRDVSGCNVSLKALGGVAGKTKLTKHSPSLIAADLWFETGFKHLCFPFFQTIYPFEEYEQTFRNRKAQKPQKNRFIPSISLISRLLIDLFLILFFQIFFCQKSALHRWCFSLNRLIEAPRGLATIAWTMAGSSAFAELYATEDE